MSTTKHLQTLNVYTPPPVARLVFENPLQPLAGTWRRFHAVTMFADISGFTPLAEALAADSAQGAEELNSILNRVFESLITTIESHGGQVVSFDGDALSIIWPYEPRHMIPTIWRTLQAAFAMQSTIAGFTIIPTSQGDFDLQMKIGVSVGEILEVHAGGELNRVEYVLAGKAMTNMSKAENLAYAGEIVVDQYIWKLVNGLDFHAVKQIMNSTNNHQTTLPESYIVGVKAETGFYRITHLWSKLPPSPLTPPDWSQLDTEATTQAITTLHKYIPAAVSNTLKNGYQKSQPQLRSMTVCFFGFSGIDYTNDLNAGPRVDHFLRDAQKAIYRYEGSINKLNVGDKGSVLLILFGAPPFVHTDDEARAVACALDLRQVTVEHGLEMQVGLASGPVFLGPLGATRRREYTVIGDVVNRAARLMQKADPGQVLVDTSVHQKAKQYFMYQDLGKTQVKGRSKPLHVYLVAGEKEQKEQSVVRYLLGSQEAIPDSDFFTGSNDPPAQRPTPATA
jgi:class 3 adenylate cyclase